jgi:hypothetical protein
MQQARARGIPQSVLSQREMHVLRKWLKDYRIGGSTDQACERIVRRCRQRNIAVVLIAPPLSSDHRQCYTPQIEAAFLDRLRGLAERYACRFVDYRDRMPDTMFLDNHHLHLEGAQELSRQLVEEVLAPAWIAR